MRKENNVQNIVIILLAVVVLVMTVGYAAFASTLTINSSTATFKKAKWDVHFDTNSLEETSTITAATPPTVTQTSVSFAVTLNKPGDVYSFTVDAVNAGTIDAKLKKITMSTLTAEQAEFVDYTISYNGADYTTTTDNINANLLAEDTDSITVTVEYKLPADPEDLPTEQDVTVNLSANFDYVDAL